MVGCVVVVIAIAAAAVVVVVVVDFIWHLRKCRGGGP